MSGVLGVLSVAALTAMVVRSSSALVATAVQWSQRKDDAPWVRPNHRAVRLVARLTGARTRERYAEEWAAEWHDLPQRPRRIRAMYLLRISARAIPLGSVFKRSPVVDHGVVIRRHELSDAEWEFVRP
ncbi:hypothetical protein, partial [Streptomyces sp. NPDC090025]|uniref:hypothetical protein n=1 Tax=Streptomyces sp. NPDC090025 TaxID=3365922 RepID=UPI003836E159